MFTKLLLQIQHQYGKYLHFNEAKNGNNDPVMGIRDDHASYFRDETIVQLIPKRDGNNTYQVKHQYGKYLNFNEAKNGNNDPVMGIRDSYSVLWMNKGCYEDETIVQLIPKRDRDGNNAYQVKHQYGKYLHFNEAKNGSNNPVMGIRDDHVSYFRDETIVRLIPINYKLVLKIEGFQYNEPEEGSLNVINYNRVLGTFINRTNVTQKFSISETVTLNDKITLTHDKQEIQQWLSKVSGGIEICANNTKSLSYLPSANIGFNYTWQKQTVSQFHKSIVKNTTTVVQVTENIDVEPGKTVTVDHISKQLQSSIPYQAEMKISCTVGDNYVSSNDLLFILYNTGNYPGDGNIQDVSNVGIYSTQLTGAITPSIYYDSQVIVSES